MSDRNPAVTGTLRWFDHDHLPEGLIRNTSRRCHELAYTIVDDFPDSPELTLGLRKLLEAKDCFVRCAVAG